MTDPPALPPRLSEPIIVIVVGLAVSVIGAAVCLVVSLVGGGPLGETFWTFVAAIGVGLFGASVFAWQRSAARRGSRLAQTGVEE